MAHFILPPELAGVLKKGPCSQHHVSRGGAGSCPLGPGRLERGPAASARVARPASAVSRALAGSVLGGQLFWTLVRLLSTWF